MSVPVAPLSALLLWVAVAAAGCGDLSPSPETIAPSLAGLSPQDFPVDVEPGRYRIEVTGGELKGLEGRATRLQSGETRFNVVNRVPGARTDKPGLDLSERAIALWLRGRGDARHRLPQYSIGPVNAGVQEDWVVDLPPGDYLLSVTMGGVSEATLVVRSAER